MSFLHLYLFNINALEGRSGSGLKVACDGEGGDDDGEVCFDGILSIIDKRVGGFRGSVVFRCSRA